MDRYTRGISVGCTKYIYDYDVPYSYVPYNYFSPPCSHSRPKPNPLTTFFTPRDIEYGPSQYPRSSS